MDISAVPVPVRAKIEPDAASGETKSVIMCVLVSDVAALLAVTCSYVYLLLAARFLCKFYWLTAYIYEPGQPDSTKIDKV